MHNKRQDGRKIAAALRLRAVSLRRTGKALWFFFSLSTAVLLCSCAQMIGLPLSYTFPGDDVVRVSFDTLKPKTFSHVRLLVDLPETSGLWPGLMVDQFKSGISIKCQLSYPPRGSGGLEVTRSFCYLSIWRCAPSFFAANFPHFFFFSGSLESCEQQIRDLENMPSLNDAQKALLTEDRERRELLIWAKQPHPQADSFRIHLVRTEKERYWRGGEPVQYQVVRWFQSDAGDYIMCTGTVHPDGDTRGAYDLAGCRKILDSVRPISGK